MHPPWLRVGHPDERPIADGHSRGGMYAASAVTPYIVRATTPRRRPNVLSSINVVPGADP